GELLACEKACAESCASVSGDGLNVNTFEATAKLKRANEENVEKDAAGEAERVGGGRFAEVGGEGDDDFLKAVLRAASDVGTEHRIELQAGLRQSSFAIEARRKDAAPVGARGEIAAIQIENAF